MEKLLCSLCALLFLAFFNQNLIGQTGNFFEITGNVQTEIVVGTDSLASFQVQKLDSVVIFNHLGERKSTLNNLEVVRLRDVLSRATIQVESPKLLSEFYFTCTATDGYKVVFSWNEMFNNPLGDSIFIILRREGKTPEDRPEGIALLSPTDAMTGRRYVKNLEKITVCRAD